MSTGFSFTNPSSNSSSSPSTSAFNFSNLSSSPSPFTAATATATTPALSLFSNQSSTPSFGSTTASTSSTFTGFFFSTSSSMGTSNLFSGSQQQPSSTPFGLANTSSASNPSFGISSSTTIAPSFGFVPTNPSSATTTTTATASTPLFGSNSTPFPAFSTSSVFGGSSSSPISSTAAAATSAPSFSNMFSLNSSSSSPFSTSALAFGTGSTFSKSSITPAPITTSTAAASSLPTQGSFSFGTPTSSPFQSSVGFGTQQASSAAASTATVSSSPALKTGNSGLFGTTSAPSFSNAFSNISASTPAASSIVTTPSSTPSFSLSQASAPAASTPSFSLSQASAPAASTPSFSLSQASASAPAASTPSFSLSQASAPAASTPSFPLLQASAPAASTPSFSLSQASAPAAPSFSFPAFSTSSLLGVSSSSQISSTTAAATTSAPTFSNMFSSNSSSSSSFSTSFGTGSAFSKSSITPAPTTTFTASASSLPTQGSCSFPPTSSPFQSSVGFGTQQASSAAASTATVSPSLIRADFDLCLFREKIMLAIIRHDLPFQFVEYEGIRAALRYINESITLVSRNNAKDYILKIYMREKGRIRDSLHAIPGRISLTSDLWTSISTDGYISLTAHFVDCDWKLKKVVLNFSFMPTPHTGIALSEKLYNLLSEWGIEEKMFSLTLDNASANDMCVNFLIDQLNLKNALLCNGMFLHIRCCADILNLIVQDGLKEVDSSIVKIRESVKYLKGSQHRKQKFRNCINHVSLLPKRALKQDVPTRWNSTFLMLESALYYRRAFVQLMLSDLNYNHCPTELEWEKATKICKFLGVFYKVTCMFSGSQYLTANLYFPQVFLVQDTITRALQNRDTFIYDMGVEMNKKFEKYWSTYSVILAIAVVLDPRYKLQFVSWSYTRLYNNDCTQYEEVKEKLFSLYDQYKKSSSESVGSTSRNQPSDISPDILSYQNYMDVVLQDFDSFDAEKISITNKKTHLELYLDEPRLDRKAELDVLDFWKGNQYRYPELSFMARDILSIPISTVASKAAFIVGGRVIDKFRSALKPEDVEALVCTRDWIFDKIDDMEPDVDELCEDVISLNNHEIRDGNGAIVDGISEN